MYFARHYARLGQPQLAIDALRMAAQSGFVCAPTTLKSDPWFGAVRKHRKFGSLLVDAKGLVDEAQLRFRQHASSWNAESPLPL